MISPFEFRPYTFYPFAWLNENLGIEKQTFLNRLGLQRTGRDRLLQDGLFGWEVIDALERIRTGEQSLPAADVKPSAKPRGRRAKTVAFIPIKREEYLTDRGRK